MRKNKSERVTYRPRCQPGIAISCLPARCRLRQIPDSTFRTGILRRRWRRRRQSENSRWQARTSQKIVCRIFFSKPQIINKKQTFAERQRRNFFFLGGRALLVRMLRPCHPEDHWQSGETGTVTWSFCSARRWPPLPLRAAATDSRSLYCIYVPRKVLAFHSASRRRRHYRRELSHELLRAHSRTLTIKYSTPFPFQFFFFHL